MLRKHETLPEPVYYIESPEDDTVLVGIGVAIETNADGPTTITWYDTSHERAMTAEEIHQEDGRFAFKRSAAEGGQSYKFIPMDLSIYNDKVKHELMSGKDFDSKEELIRAFLKTAR